MSDLIFIRITDPRYLKRTLYVAFWNQLTLKNAGNISLTIL